MQSPFLLELGCEEIPEKQLEIAINHIKTSFTAFTESNRLACSGVKVYQTPRRLVLLVDALDIRQEDVEIIKAGPAVNIAFTPEGKLSPAGLGFLRKNGVDEASSYIQETEKGKFLGVKFTQQGMDTAELLKAWIPQMITGIPFAKKMVWSEPGLAFSRPLRWILALWGQEVLPLEFHGIMADRTTRGNRYLGLDRLVQVNCLQDYLTTLLQEKVVVDPELRRESIRKQLAEVLQNTDLQVVEDNRLVDTVANLVEFPTAVVGEFEPHYLALPEKIITSTISQNQKYFSVCDAQGKLTNRFVFISNGDPEASELIRKGNEKVVNARLADALWYYGEDTKHPLDWYVPKLEEVVFQSQLGTMADKTLRIKALAEKMIADLHLDAASADQVLTCARQCKADLVTTMLGEKEFTKLQGYIGMQYALAGGEDPEVAKGIYEHYMPRGSADDLPSTLCGSIVAICDKMDTVAGIIGIGMLPTGSGDPFALRRAANGIVQIISQQGWDIDLYALADAALDYISRKVGLHKDARNNVHGFFDQRVMGLLAQQGIGYDVIDSVMHVAKNHIPDLEHRAGALQKLKSHDDFIRLVIGFKRVSNIIADDTAEPEFLEQAMVEPAERNLYNELQILRHDIDTALLNRDYGLALQKLIGFGAVIDKFFDDVLVNCDNQALKTNRHALLLMVRREFLRVADLSLIVLEGENKE